jgi:hypothetical protein
VAIEERHQRAGRVHRKDPRTEHGVTARQVNAMSALPTSRLQHCRLSA